MIYRTEIYNGYVLGEAREKSAFPFFYEAFFLVKGHYNPELVNPRLFNHLGVKRLGFISHDLSNRNL